MSSSTVSMLDYLRKKDPSISRNECQPGPNTKSGSGYWKVPTRIEEWRDFEYDSLQSMYGGKLQGILNSQFSLHDFSKHIPPCPFREIWDENSLETLVVKWNQSTVCEALLATHRRLGPHHGHVVMVKGGQAHNPVPEKKGLLRPDWAAVIRYTRRGGKPKNILPGDTKLSKKWSSGKIVLEGLDKEGKDADWILPLSQVYTYCLHSDSRYGYIITDKELVVLRCRPEPRSELLSDEEGDESQASINATPAQRALRTGGILEYKAVLWGNGSKGSKSDPNLLTVNLALWYLHLMAAENSHIEDHYEPLRDLIWNTDTSSPTTCSNYTDEETKISDWSYLKHGANLRTPSLRSTTLFRDDEVTSVDELTPKSASKRRQCFHGDEVEHGNAKRSKRPRHRPEYSL